ncbi:MAG TPA: hypothetical protein VGI22_02925 [Xanthobacteraceae bacterium]
MPLLDSIRVIVNDSPEPIRSEFRAIVETQSFGLPLGEACAAAPDGTRESSRERQRQNGRVNGRGPAKRFRDIITGCVGGPSRPFPGSNKTLTLTSG